MSIYLHGLATQAALSANLKAVFCALCDAAGEDDGTKCFPSIAYLSYKTGFSRRHVQRLIRALELANYIEPVAHLGGGRKHTTWYHIHIKRVPMKPPWAEVKRRVMEEYAQELDELPSEAVTKKPRRKRVRAAETPVIHTNVDDFSTALKGDILSPFNGAKGDKMSPFNAERATFCHP